jgi:hypothetical protein
VDETYSREPRKSSKVLVKLTINTQSVRWGNVKTDMDCESNPQDNPGVMYTRTRPCFWAFRRQCGMLV